MRKISIFTEEVYFCSTARFMKKSVDVEINQHNFRNVNFSILVTLPCQAQQKPLQSIHNSAFEKARKIGFLSDHFFLVKFGTFSKNSNAVF